MTVMRRIRAVPSWQVTLGVALLALGFLIAAQLASEGPRVQYTTQERTPLVETANELQSQQDGLKARILDLGPRSRRSRARARARPSLVKQLNARARAGAHRRRADRADRARASSSSSRTRRRRCRPMGARRTTSSGRVTSGRGRRAVGRGRRGDRGQRRTDHPDLGDHRRRDLAAGQLGLPRAAVPDHRARRARPVRPVEQVAGLHRLRPGAQRGLRHPGLVGRPGLGRRARLRRHGHAPLLAAAPVAVRGAIRRRRAAVRGPDVHRRSSQLTIAAVAVILGLLVVIQLRSEAGSTRARAAVGAGPDRPRRQPECAQRPAPPGELEPRERAGDADRQPVARRRIRRRDHAPTCSASAPTPASNPSPAPG